MTEQNSITRPVLKALVIMPNPKTQEMGSLLAIARAEARKRERTQQNLPILALRYIPELNIYVAVYATSETQKQTQTKKE